MKKALKILKNDIKNNKKTCENPQKTCKKIAKNSIKNVKKTLKIREKNAKNILKTSKKNQKICENNSKKSAEKSLKIYEKNIKKTLKIDNKNTKSTSKNDEKCAKNHEKNDEKSIIICEKNDENQSKLTDLQVENFDLNLLKKTKQNFEKVKIFKKNAINLSEFENENLLLEKVCEALYNLSHSKVWDGNLMVGGKYHKNQYFFIEKGFLHEKSAIFCAKNIKFKQFGQFVKQNLCNFGLYFCAKNNRPFLKIFCGNGFLIENTIQNYIEKFVQKSL